MRFAGGPIRGRWLQGDGASFGYGWYGTYHAARSLTAGCFAVPRNSNVDKADKAYSWRAPDEP